MRFHLFRFSTAAATAAMMGVLLGGFTAQDASGQTFGSISVDTNNNVRTIDSGGKPVSVAGNDNKITIRGDCPRVDVSGNDNTVRIEKTAVIRLRGNDNHVYWTGGRTKADPPQISNLGNDNIVQRSGSGRASANKPVRQPTSGGGELSVTGTGVTRTIAANGRAISVVGSGAKLTVTGNCPRLSVAGSGSVVRLQNCGTLSISGSGNEISAVSVTVIRIDGSGNDVSWRNSPSPGGKPRIANSGTGNSISKR